MSTKHVQRVHSNTHGHHQQQQHQQQHPQQIQTQKPKKKPKEQITYYELLELEKQKNEAESVKITIKRSFPIAPDGFIPNSVVRKFFQLLDPGPKQPEKKIWKLKWKPPEALAEENIAEDEEGSTVYNPQNFNFDWTSDEEEGEKEKDTADNETDDIPTNLDGEQKFLSEILKRLKEQDWFKQPNEVTVETLTKYLINKLIERDPSNHEIISSFIKEIKANCKMSKDLVNWLLTQLEDELDGTNFDIILNTVGIVSAYGIETYNIDLGLLNLLEQRTKPKEFKSRIMDMLCNLTNLDESQINIALSEIKKLHGGKYKKAHNNFKLKNFIDDIEQSKHESQKEVDSDSLTNSETFKAILKEDWIPGPIKETLKTLKDFLNYLLKSLKTVKSKIFYDKICNFYHTLYNEFKLAGTEWERHIIDHFKVSNTDAKSSEQLRLVDIDNIAKYYPSTPDAGIKSEILVELLRSASHEKKRPQVQEAARAMLKKLTGMSDDELDGLIKYFSNKNFGKDSKLTWQDALDKYRNKSELSDNDANNLTSSSFNASNDFDSGIDSYTSSHKDMDSNKKDKKSHHKKSSKEKSKSHHKKDHKVEKEKKEKAKPEMIRERTEPLEEKSSKPIKMTVKGDKDDNDLVIHLNKDQPHTEIRVSDGEHGKDSTANKQEHKDDTRGQENEAKRSKGSLNPNLTRNKTNLLPNKVESWDYYKFRNESNEENKTVIKQENEMDDFIQRKHSSQLDGFGKNNNNKDDSQFISSNDMMNNQNNIIDPNNEADKFDLFSSIDGGSLFEFDVNEQDKELRLIDENFKNTHRKHELERKKTSRELLDGITKRVVFNEMQNANYPYSKVKNTKTNLNKLYPFLNGYHEKCHLIEPFDLNEQPDKNMRFSSLVDNRRRKEVEYNQLLECLIIRGLELHKHYERLLPPSAVLKVNETFVPLSYFSDFLVVHPYNAKSSIQANGTAVNNNNNNEGLRKEPTFDLFEQGHYSMDNITNLYPSRRAIRTNRHTQHEAKVSDFDLNHIFLINKLLISYGAQNVRQFYASVNTNFKNYLQKLHSRIPHRIIPLIWNDPVIQKLAYIISSSANKMRKAPEKEKEVKEKEKRDYSLESKITQQQTLKPVVLNKTTAQNMMRSKTLGVSDNALNLGKRVINAENESSSSLSDFKKLPAIQHPLIGTRIPPQNPYGSWPIFKRDDTPRNKVAKRKLYSHLMNVKHEYMKLQWRYMIQDDPKKKPQASYLPSLSLKATLNLPEI